MMNKIQIVSFSYDRGQPKETLATPSKRVGAGKIESAEKPAEKRKLFTATDTRKITMITGTPMARTIPTPTARTKQ